MSHIVAYVEKDKIWPNVNFVTIFALLIRIFIVYALKYVSQTKYFSLVLVPLQIVKRNYIYTILYMPEGIHIWHSNWLLSVDYNKGLSSDHRIFTSEGFVVSTFRQTLRLTTLKIYYKRRLNRPMKTPGRIFSIIPSCQSD